MENIKNIIFKKIFRIILILSFEVHFKVLNVLISSYVHLYSYVRTRNVHCMFDKSIQG